MALGGANVGWNEGVPSSLSAAGLGEADIRSVKTAVRNALDSEHVFGSSGGAGTGAHRKGSAVAFYGTASALSSTDTNGRVMVTSDTSRLFHAGSDNTIFLGGRFVPEMYSGLSIAGVNTVSKTSQAWTIEAGRFTFQLGSTGTVMTLQQSYVVGTAIVSPINSGNSIGGVPVFSSINGNQMTVLNFTPDGLQSASSATYIVSYAVFGIKAL